MSLWLPGRRNPEAHKKKAALRRPLLLFCEKLCYGLAGVAGLLAAGLAAGADEEPLTGYC